MDTITYYTQHWILLVVLSTTIRGDQHTFDEKVKVLDQAITLLNQNFLQVLGLYNRLEENAKQNGSLIQKARRPSDRIVNGETVVRHTMPWQVALVEKNTTILHCGGSIICPKFVISAAHCSFKFVDWEFRPDEHDILVGEHELSNPVSARHAIKKIHPHPEYNATNNDLDVSIYELSQPIEMTPKVQAVHLPEQSDHDLNEGTVMVVSGWGLLEDGGIFANELQVTKIPIVSDKDCKHAYPQRFTTHMVCVGYLDTGQSDSCKGDSGGPLVWLDSSTNKVKLYGCVSFGDGCAQPGKPGVYAKVSTFLDWVSEVTRDCNRETCKISTNCMTGDKLDPFTKSFFSQPTNKVPVKEGYM